jgi:hypothetical protein
MGSSLHSLLAPHLSPVDMQLGVSEVGEGIQDHYRTHIGLHKHSLGYEISDVLGESFFKTFKTFACIREPIDRLLSAYFFLKSKENDIWWIGSDDEKFMRSIFQMNSVGDFLRSGIWRQPRIISNIFSPQVDFVRNDSGAWLVDSLILLDRAQKDVDVLCISLNINSSSIPLFNETERKSSENISSELLQEVLEYYRDDVQLYLALKNGTSPFCLTGCDGDVS